MAPGFRVSQDHYILLFRGNTEEDCKLKPVLLYRSANPGTLKGFVKNILLLHFYADSKGWVPSHVFCYFLVLKMKFHIVKERLFRLKSNS